MLELCKNEPLFACPANGAVSAASDFLLSTVRPADRAQLERGLFIRDFVVCESL